MLAVLCVRGGRAIDFRVMVGRLVGEAMGAFGALNLPSEKCPVIPNPRADGRWSERGITSTCIEAALSGSAWLRTPPDAGLKPMKLPQNHENENGFAKLKPSPATDATHYLGGSEARD